MKRLSSMMLIFFSVAVSLPVIKKVIKEIYILYSVSEKSHQIFLRIFFFKIKGEFLCWKRIDKI